MKQKKIKLAISSVVLAGLLLSMHACTTKAPASEGSESVKLCSAELFDVAFFAMQEKADELGLKGVAMAAFLEDTSTINWLMATRIMGTVEFPHGENPGWNIIAMVGSKIGETMLTHMPSGHCPRPLMHGEVGFAGAEDPLNGEGAEFIDLGGAYCVCVFGGGPHEQDYIIGRAGAQAMQKAFQGRN